MNAGRDAGCSARLGGRRGGSPQLFHGWLRRLHALSDPRRRQTVDYPALALTGLVGYRTKLRGVPRAAHVRDQPLRLDSLRCWSGTWGRWHRHHDGRWALLAASLGALQSGSVFSRSDQHPRWLDRRALEGVPVALMQRRSAPHDRWRKDLVEAAPATVIGHVKSETLYRPAVFFSPRPSSHTSGTALCECLGETGNHRG